MSFLSDIFKDNTNASCILLHGNVTDSVISKDLCFRDFSVVLADTLREHGFDNVVFYDATNALGKYVLDDASAYYSIHEAKEPYLKKYGQPPNGQKQAVPAQTGQPTQAAQAAQPAQPAPVKKPIKTFGKPRKPAAAQPQTNVAAQPAPAQPAPSQPVQPSGGLSDKIPYQQKHLLETVFYGECQSFMNNTAYRSAVIVTDINNFLQREQSRIRYAQLIHNQWRGKNLMIFIHPDLTAGKDELFFHLLKQSGILEYFYTPGSCRNDYIPKQGRVFPIKLFARDEIFYLLRYHQLYNGLTIPEGIAVAAEKIAYIIHSIQNDTHRSTDRNFMLRSLHAKMQTLLADSPETELNDVFLEKWLDCPIAAFDFDPWQTLKSRHGWESVVQELEELFQGLEPVKESLVVHAEKTLLVERLNGSANKAYPTANQLPHLMLEGSPGTGKTTIIEQIGRILRDYGLLSTGHIVKAYRKDLIADVIGGTARNVHTMLERAENGVLFIDEAYDLCKDYDKGGNAGVFAEEAVNTLVNAMTDEARHVVVIFAGYRCSSVDAVDGVQGLFKMNQGLRSRIKRVLSIPDYTPDILTKIFFQVLEKKGYTLADDLSEETIATFMENVYQARNRRDFSNGRFVKEVLIERKLIPNAKARGDFQTITRADFAEDGYKLEPITLEAVEKELAVYPGLGEIGMSIVRDYVDFREMQLQDGIQPDDIDNLKHLIFRGNPGTGKTTIVKLLCKALGAVNIMSGAPPILISNPETVTLPQLEEKIKDAVNMNTILCIDEAHNCPCQVIHTLLNPMSENKKLTCVFCVYPHRYKEFLDKDKGLERRTRTYPIDDYTPDQLLEIFKVLADKGNRTYSEDCIHQVAVLLQNWYQNRTTKQGYGNAAEVEELLGKMKENCYRRTKADTFSAAEKRLLLPADIPADYQEIIKNQTGNRSVEEILEHINSFDGWQDLKEWLQKKYNQLQYKKTKKPNHVIRKKHMRFVGSPGTGKTTAGELFAEAVYAMGLVPANRFRYYLAKDLIAGFVGQTGEKAAKALEEGRNGVIFIDEAYSLAYDDAGGVGDSYKRDMIEYLLAFSEQHQDTTIIILAGYEQKIDRLMHSNEGLRSRFPEIIRFPDYDPAACARILRAMLEKENSVASDWMELAERYFQQICRIPDFGNARDVKNISHAIQEVHVERMIDDDTAEDCITAADVEKGFAFWKSKNL